MFHKIIILIFVSLFASGSAFADMTETNFELAGKAYANADYKKALAVYQMLETQGSVSGELYYNMGNTYLKLNNKGMAKLYYLRAHNLMPRDSDLKENMIFLNSLLIDKVKSGQNYIEGKTAWIRDMFSLQELLSGMIFFYILVLFFILLFLFFRGFNRLFFSFTAVSSVCFLLVSFFYFMSYYNLKNNPKAVVVSNSARLFYSPAVSDNPAFIVHEGLSVIIVKKQEDWMQVNIETSDMSGWIAASDVALV